MAENYFENLAQEPARQDKKSTCSEALRRELYTDCNAKDPIVAAEAPFSDKQIEDYSVAVSKIILRHGDFSNGQKNEKIRDAFYQAAGAGETGLDKLIHAVNDKLAANRLTLRATWSKESNEQLRELGEYCIATYPLIYLDSSFLKKEIAHVKLSLNSGSGEEDSLKIDRLLSQQTIYKQYQPPLPKPKDSKASSP